MECWVEKRFLVECFVGERCVEPPYFEVYVKLKNYLFMPVIEWKAIMKFLILKKLESNCDAWVRVENYIESSEIYGK